MKGFIFDLDGVIVSTDGLHYLAWKQMADEEGIYFDEKINNRLRGVSRMDSLEIILERAERQYSDEEKQILATKKNEIYKELLKSLTPDDRLPGVTETLNELRARGYKLAIGSSSKNTPAILKYIGLEKFFDAVSDGNNITRSKPDPEVFIKGALFLGLQPSECYVVEDAKAGVDAGKAGGFATIALGDAYGYESADYSISHFEEILNIIK
ncbi:MAG: beta-phosphoglucomutase [Eubacteriales bacterium]